jgi:hypothetical protein
MYVAVRQGKAHPGAIPEVARRIEGTGVPLFQALPDFVAYYFVDLGNDEGQSITVFESRQAAEEANAATVEWARGTLADLMVAPLQARTGEVLIHLVP